MQRLRTSLAAFVVSLPLLAATGCAPGQLDQIINTLSDAVNSTIDNLQGSDIVNGPLPRGAGDVRGLGGIELFDDAGVITNPDQDLKDVDPKSVALVGFENDTEFDMFLDYLVDDEPQSVFVPAGETTLLRYRCFSGIELIAEWDFDPETGDFVMSYQLGDMEFPPGFDDDGFEGDDFDDDFGDDEFGDDEFGDDEFGDDEFGDDGFGDDDFGDDSAQMGPDDMMFEEFPDDDFGDSPPPFEFDSEKEVGNIRGTGCGHLIVITITETRIDETDFVPLDQAAGQ